MENPRRPDQPTPQQPEPAGAAATRGRTQAEIDAEIELLGDIPLYEPAGDADELEATAVHRPLEDDATPTVAEPSRPATRPTAEFGEATTAAQRLDAYDWLFASQHRTIGPRPPLWRQDGGAAGVDGPPTAPLTPVGVRRTHPVAAAVPHPSRPANRPAAHSAAHRPAAARSADRRRRRGGRVVLVTLVLAICLSLGSAAAMVGFRLSENGTSLAGLLGPDASAAPTTSGDDPAPGTVWNGALVPIAGVTASASCVDPPGNDEGTPVPYEPANLLDDDPATAWRCTDGTPTVTFELPADALIAEVGLINGYAKNTSGLDRYELYQRALLVRWTFADGTSVTQELRDDTRTVQTMSIPVRAGGTVTLEVLKVSSPSVQSATRDSLALSGVTFNAPVG